MKIEEKWDARRVAIDAGERDDRRFVIRMLLGMVVVLGALVALHYHLKNIPCTRSDDYVLGSGQCLEKFHLTIDRGVAICECRAKP